MSYIEHAKRELTAIGYDLNGKEDDLNKWIVKNILELLEVFSKQGHSGSSAPYCANIFKKLALYEPLCPITGEDHEWHDVGNDTFQNIRCSAVFKQGRDGRPYYLDAIVWRTPTGATYTGSTAEGITSRQYIRLPFEPKTFFIDVDEHEVAKDGWEFTIKNLSDLNQVFEYYDRFDKVA